jgi:hypothetical protein
LQKITLQKKSKKRFKPYHNCHSLPFIKNAYKYGVGKIRIFVYLESINEKDSLIHLIKDSFAQLDIKTEHINKLCVSLAERKQKSK